MPQAMVKPFVQFLNLGNVDNALLSDVWHFSEDGQHASFEQLHWCKLCLAADQGQDWCTNSPSLATVGNSALLVKVDNHMILSSCTMSISSFCPHRKGTVGLPSHIKGNPMTKYQTWSCILSHVFSQGTCSMVFPPENEPQSSWN